MALGNGTPGGGATLGRADFIQRHGCWTDAQRDAARRVEALVRERDIHTIRMAFSDLHGIARAKTLMQHDLAQAFQHGFAASSAVLAMDSSNNIVLPVFSEDGGFGVPGMGGAGDLLIVPDPTTFRILPWADRTGWVLGDWWLTSGQRVPLDTRHLFRTALADLEGRGLQYLAGLEVEFYIFRLVDPKLALTDSGPRPAPPEVEALTHGFQYMSEVHLDEAGSILDILRENILDLGLPLRTIEDEWGPGQCEFTFDPQVGIDAADTMFLFRSAVKQICRRHGYLATFMCKPGVPGVYSSGWHLHESLRDAATGANAFVQPDGSSIVSPLARHFIGGLLEHAAATSPFSNPTVNGYKRLNMNPLAPNRPVWAHDNKAAFIRVIGGGAEPVTHIENRSGEPAANPYLFMAAQIIAGLDGIDRQLDPGDPRPDPYAQVDLPLLPMHLPDALAVLERSTLFRERMGGAFIDYFLNVKRQEVARFLAHVTDWEHREYFEAF